MKKYNIYFKYAYFGLCRFELSHSQLQVSFQKNKPLYLRLSTTNIGIAKSVKTV